MSGSDRQAPEESWAEARARRERALRDLAQRELGAAGDMAAQTSGSSPSTPRPSLSLTPRTRPRRRGRLVAVGLVAAVVLAGVGGYLVAHRLAGGRASATATATLSPPTVLRPITDELSCQQDVALSPDGRRVAVLGYVHDVGTTYSDCPQFITGDNPSTPTAYFYLPGEIAIYPATGSAPAQKISLDPIVTAALHLHPPSNAAPKPRIEFGNGVAAQIINYGRMLWSADGTRLLVTFNIPGLIADTSSGPTTYGTITQAVGLLRTDLTGSATQVTSHAVAPDGSQSLGTWDLATGAYTPYPPAPAGSSFVQQGPPLALGYAWDTSAGAGTLQPQQPLSVGTPPAAAPLSAIGRPTDASFGVWQPGRIAPVTYSVPAGQATGTIADTYALTTDLFAWSPDGRYATQTPLAGLLEPGAPPDPSLLQQGYVSSLAVLPMRDKGLRAALAALAAAQAAPAGNLGQGLTMDVAWSPDGTRLATLLAVATLSTTNRLTFRTSVTVYDCASGAVLATLAPAAAINPLSLANDTFAWSPDGTRLLAFTAQLGEISVWNLHSLR